MATAKKLVRKARGSMLRLEALPSEARAMDVECSARLRELGVTGFHEMQTADGRRFRVPEYFCGCNRHPQTVIDRGPRGSYVQPTIVFAYEDSGDISHFRA